MHLSLCQFRIAGGKPEILVDISDFIQFRLDIAVRGNEAIHTERAVVRLIFPVSAVRVIFALRLFGVQCLVREIL